MHIAQGRAYTHPRIPSPPACSPPAIHDNDYTDNLPLSPHRPALTAALSKLHHMSYFQSATAQATGVPKGIITVVIVPAEVGEREDVD